MNESITSETQSNLEQHGKGPRTSMERLRAASPLALALLLSLGIMLLVIYLREYVEALEGYGYLGAFVVGFLGNATVILPAPSLAFTTALGGVLNPILVGITAGAGEAIGELTGYLAGVGSKPLLDQRSHYETVKSYMDRYGAWVFFVLAAVPNPLFDVAGIVGGVVRFPVWKFLLTAWAGKTLKAIIFAQVGHQFLR